MRKSYLDKDSSDPSLPMNRPHASEYDAMKAQMADIERRAPMTAWLIEWPEDDNNPVRWWNPAHGWMRDANKALAFARQTDADCFLSTMKFGLHLKVTEHVFVGDEFRHALPGHDETMANLDALRVRR